MENLREVAQGIGWSFKVIILVFGGLFWLAIAVLSILMPYFVYKIHRYQELIAKMMWVQLSLEQKRKVNPRRVEIEAEEEPREKKPTPATVHGVMRRD